MGQQISKIVANLSWFQNKKARIVLVGLDAAGKTTLLYKLKLDEEVATIPTIGFNVESLEYKNVTFTMWDIGGQDRIRKLWRHYYQGTDAIIFVVDANDRERIPEAADELHRMLQDDLLRDAVLLIFANKQDLPNPMSSDEIVEAFKLKCFKDRTWYVQPCVAITGHRLYDGLDWLGEQLK
mmetsp:Transcript_166/g.285  ORF Transcript_166/g.285 Transcript_166/m.285 type:complete len:181 (+) Transcript_166:52-594(+)